MSDVLEIRGDLRVRLAHDGCAAEPYFEGRSPILRLYPSRSWGGWRGEYIDSIGAYTPTAADDILTAAEKWAGGPDLFERYLRMFHGTTAVEWYDGRPGGGDFVYVTFDTAGWRARYDLPDDVAGIVDLSEWRAYCEGDVYGYVVEERATWQRTNGAGEVAETRETWEPVDSCWGFYGHQYAETAGRSVLDAMTSALPAAA
ncbi:hypothetical protein ACTOB_007926 [Actinoplanes oblitus]|uniref:YubB ferredoxin-like domain-containing protein n=1 Tax=Actinoplanes oblitus TaxID=3040509 RepID=A0ABY8WEG7_9ACTN|nr:hypothetical protein [Actinoplanes oblitus]WIM95792.1 hypothetical protein ACTOB_007926 [Actinoplanes oblitus]